MNNVELCKLLCRMFKDSEVYTGAEVREKLEEVLK